MSDIQCSFSSQGSSVADMITARLKKPSGFKGAPLFADDRTVNPETDRTCVIRQDLGDADGISYNLKIMDFSRCGVLKRNVSPAHSFQRDRTCERREIVVLTLMFSAGIRARTDLVSAISWRCDAIGSRVDYHVQAARANSYPE